MDGTSSIQDSLLEITDTGGLTLSSGDLLIQASATASRETGSITVDQGSSSGDVSITGGNALSGNSFGGSVRIDGGDASGTSFAGGINLIAGVAPSSGPGGNIVLTAGSSVTGQGGDIRLASGGGGTAGRIELQSTDVVNENGNGRLIYGDGTNAPTFIVAKGSTSNCDVLDLREGGTGTGNIRWTLRHDSLEQFTIRRYNTSGVFQTSPFTISNATGATTIGTPNTTHTVSSQAIQMRQTTDGGTPGAGNMRLWMDSGGFAGHFYLTDDLDNDVELDSQCSENLSLHDAELNGAGCVLSRNATSFTQFITMPDAVTSGS
jgi:hypothetical protein